VEGSSFYDLPKSYENKPKKKQEETKELWSKNIRINK